MFDQADGFVLAVKFVEAMRKHLSPETKQLSTKWDDTSYRQHARRLQELIPAAYWNLSERCMRTYSWNRPQLGIDVVNESQLVGYPSQFPSTSMVDWKDGSRMPGTAYCSILHDNLSADDRPCGYNMDDAPMWPRRHSSPEKRESCCLVNKRNWAIAVALPGDFATGRATTVDVTTGAQPPVTKSFEGPRACCSPSLFLCWLQQSENTLRPVVLHHLRESIADGTGAPERGQSTILFPLTRR